MATLLRAAAAAAARRHLRPDLRRPLAANLLHSSYPPPTPPPPLPTSPPFFFPAGFPLENGRISGVVYRLMSTTTAQPKESSENKPVESIPQGEEKTGETYQTGSSGKPIRGGPVSWLSLLLLMMTGAGILYYYDKEKRRRIEEVKVAGANPKQGPSVGKASIGGPFQLVNHLGKPVTDQDFLGKWTLIYFGFTHCPDICPDELQKMAAAVDKTKEKAGLEIVPVFISVDPERDNVEQVREYVQEFHPGLIGLTGDSASIRQVARAYRVYYMKTEDEGSDYLVDHSIVMYLMDPKMEFVKFFGKNYDVVTLSDGIINEIKQYKP